MTVASTAAQAMRQLSQQDRERLITANPEKVIGHARFGRVRRQAEIAEAYRGPFNGDVA